MQTDETGERYSKRRLRCGERRDATSERPKADMGGDATSWGGTTHGGQKNEKVLVASHAPSSPKFISKPILPRSKSS